MRGPEAPLPELAPQRRRHTNPVVDGQLVPRARTAPGHGVASRRPPDRGRARARSCGARAICGARRRRRPPRRRRTSSRTRTCFLHWRRTKAPRSASPRTRVSSRSSRWRRAPSRTRTRYGRSPRSHGRWRGGSKLCGLIRGGRGDMPRAAPGATPIKQTPCPSRRPGASACSPCRTSGWPRRRSPCCPWTA